MMEKNKSGKTFVIFLVLIVIVLVSGMAISLFMLQQEKGDRISVEKKLESLRKDEKSLSQELTDLKKQIYILNEKNKEADEKINNLLDDLELEEGLRDQLREENAKLKASVDEAEKAKEKLRDAMAQEMDSVKSQLKEAQEAMEVIKTDKDALMSTIASLEEEKQSIAQQKASIEVQYQELKSRPVSVVEPEVVSANIPVPTAKEVKERMPSSPVGAPSPVDLDPIVIDNTQGRVLSVDQRTEFLIFDMGLDDGIRPGQVVSVYRGDKFLGDVKVSRAQDKMAAADFIPPFSSTKVRKNDIVVVKPF